MKTRIQKFSPHQNAKVFAVLMAVTSLIFMLPFALYVNAVVPFKETFSIASLILVPLVYLIFGYIAVAIACLVYNLLAKFTGGIEFETLSAEP